MEYLPTAISRIFHYLIVKNEDAVKDFLPSLIFIPDHPLLSQVKAKLKKYISFERYNNIPDFFPTFFFRFHFFTFFSFRSETLRDKLIREIGLAMHETVGVRIEGLKALQLTIRKFLSKIQNLIIGSDEPDSCIKTLLECLVKF